MKRTLVNCLWGTAAGFGRLSLQKRLGGGALHWLRFAGVLVVGLAAAREGLIAQEVVRVYSSEGPSPAMCEAASAFSTNEAVKVVSGPPSEWISRAAADADVVCGSADFMMTDFLRHEALHLDPETVTPLYMRPSAILVRPGNPKRIEDFPDLIQPGIRLMVVTGSGQTGLWEDMASRTADVQTMRRLRENILCYAANSTEAVRMWRERKEVDAWITWDIWHMPLRTEAKLIPVSKNYRVFRQCSVALTRRGRDKSLAARFVKYLASPDGARIFASWGWMTPRAEASAVEVAHDITVVCGVDRNISTNGTGLGLWRVKQLIDGYEAMGVPRRELHLNVVVFGEAAHWLLQDGPYRALTHQEQGNPNQALVRQLLDSGVSVELCEPDMKKNNWSRDDLLAGIAIVSGAYQRIVDLQLRGYAYLAF